MYDNVPSSSNARAAGATAITQLAQGLRGNILYIGDVWDPDTMPADDFSKYVVPKEGWLVYDLQDSVLIWYYVYKVYQNKSELKPCDVFVNDGGTTEDQDTIFGEKGGPLNGEGIMGVDFSVRPNRASIDSTIMRPGAAYAYLYLGDDISETTGKIISAVYDKQLNRETNKIPVGLAAIENYTNKEIMWTLPFSVSLNEDALPNGARCTLVFFDQGDMVITPSQRIVVQHSSILRNRELGKRYVTDIELVSAWFTDMNAPDKLVVPITTPLVGIEFRAVVHYSDGSTVEYPVNGDKFSLEGDKEYRPAYPGDSAELVLIYTMSADEEYYIAQPGLDGRWSRTYQVVAGPGEGAYAPKLYTYLDWETAGSKWGLRHVMYDLDRRDYVDVTDKVVISESSAPFNPNRYNSIQDLTFLLTLKDVSPTYNSTIHKQQVSLIMYNDVNGPGRRWGVQYAADKPMYDAKFAKVVADNGQAKVNVANGYTNYDDWLNALYYAVQPSYDVFSEEKAPAPNAFYLVLADGTRYSHNTVDWNKDITIPSMLLKGHTVTLAWIQRDATGNEKQLAMTGLTVDVGA